MRLLLDTHVWLWWRASPDRLSESTAAALVDRANSVFISSATVWEIAIKHSLGRIELPEAPKRFVSTRMARDGFLPLPIEHQHALAAADLPRLHDDPFDRMLVAQGQLENLRLVTADETVMKYDVAILGAT